MPKDVGDQAVVTLKSIGVHQAAAFHFPDGEVEERLPFHVLHDLDPYRASPFEDAENRHSARGASSPFPLSSATEIRFVEFHLSFQGGCIPGGAGDRRPQQVMQAIGGVVCQTPLPSSFPDRRIQFEQLDRQQQDGERGLRPFEDAVFPNVPLPPTAVAPVPFGHDGCHHSADTSWMKQGARGPRDTFRQTLHQGCIVTGRYGKPHAHLLVRCLKGAVIKKGDSLISATFI